jgi:hypothetical protein
MPRGNWNQAVIDSDAELEPVDDILSMTQAVCRTAKRIVDSTEDEYQWLRNSQWSEDSPQEKRFFWLRWQREALSNFVSEAGAAAANLRAETQNVWNSRELADIEAREDARATSSNRTIVTDDSTSDDSA